MSKYITDSIRNHSRSIIKNLTRPQQKAVSQIIRGLFVKNTPILRHLVQDESKLTKKQAEKFSYHLGNINLEEIIDKFALNKALKSIKKKTVIAYDLTDIAKEHSEKIEKISRVFDGSMRKIQNGFLLHGVGINNLLVKLELHDGSENTLNQIREKIVEEISTKLNKKGIWVFDRGNDDKQFFKFLRQEAKVEFIARLKLNRKVLIKGTGVQIQVKDLKPEKYRVYLMNRHNTKVETNHEYLLVIQNHLEGKEPIRLISSLKYERYSKNQIVQMYLERWGVENLYRRIKTKFQLEKIRVLSHQKFVNLIALIQFAAVLSSLMFEEMQQKTTMWTTGILALYRSFLRQRTLTKNIDSFISFIKNTLIGLIQRKTHPPDEVKPTNQRALFSLSPS